MNSKECLKNLAALTAAYPKLEMPEAAAELWIELMQDIPYPLAESAAKHLIVTSPFPPSIHDLRKAAAEEALGPTMTGAEAWELFRKLERGLPGFTESYGTRMEKREKLPEWVAQARQVFPDWEVQHTPYSSMTTLRAQFLKFYTEYQEQKKQDLLLPGKLQKALEGGKVLELKGGK